MENQEALDGRALDVLFREARTFTKWQADGVPDALLKSVYELMKWGPTSSNCCPARFVFVKSAGAKEKLKPHLAAGNVEKTMTAPLTAIIANDMRFYEHLGRLFPHVDARSWFEGKPAAIADAAMRNGSLQGAYLMLAARAMGLDCGPMSGFDKKGVKGAFFPDDDVEINFLCNIGFGDRAGLHPRLPRFDFDEVCRVV